MEKTKADRRKRSHTPDVAARLYAIRFQIRIAYNAANFSMLNAGTTLGKYEILELLGKGGMGEVYRARDSKLKREVAIKILPEEFSRDTERVARFQREAEVLASLNHPNIASIHDVLEANDSRFLVMELVEGETLADRIAGGPTPVNDALSVAKQICEALEAAHERGIVHRDLKPANVKILPDGKVKVLDFGLAKAMQSTPDAGLSNSPTLSMSAKEAGVILGTAAYMSPEQAKGLPADARSDLFSFGCVLFEMLTGRQLFQGETVAEVMGAVLVAQPDLTALPQNLDPRLKALLQRCLDKNPRRRWQAVGDLAFELESVSSELRPTGKFLRCCDVLSHTRAYRMDFGCCRRIDCRDFRFSFFPFCTLSYGAGSTVGYHDSFDIQPLVICNIT
jgi:eukaryotic-like serine/threonine-protein kinase